MKFPIAAVASTLLAITFASLSTAASIHTETSQHLKRASGCLPILKNLWCSNIVGPTRPARTQRNTTLTIQASHLDLMVVQLDGGRLQYTLRSFPAEQRVSMIIGRGLGFPARADDLRGTLTLNGVAHNFNETHALVDISFNDLRAADLHGSGEVIAAIHYSYIPPDDLKKRGHAAPSLNEYEFNITNFIFNRGTVDDHPIKSVEFRIEKADGINEETCIAFEPVTNEMANPYDDNRDYKCGPDSMFSFSLQPNATTNAITNPDGTGYDFYTFTLFQDYSDEETWIGSIEIGPIVCVDGGAYVDNQCSLPDLSQFTIVVEAPQNYS